MSLVISGQKLASSRRWYEMRAGTIPQKKNPEAGEGALALSLGLSDRAAGDVRVEVRSDLAQCNRACVTKPSFFGERPRCFALFAA
jgi:hypothetical protein